jgi:hypothetical protein
MFPSDCPPDLSSKKMRDRLKKHKIIYIRSLVHLIQFFTIHVTCYVYYFCIVQGKKLSILRYSSIIYVYVRIEGIDSLLPSLIIHKHHHYGDAVRPLGGVSSIDNPNPMHELPSGWVG